MKTFDVLMCQRDDFGASESFFDLLERDNLKTVEVQAADSPEAVVKANCLHSTAGWMAIQCQEQQRVEGYQGFTVTE